MAEPGPSTKPKARRSRKRKESSDYEAPDDEISAEEDNPSTSDVLNDEAEAAAEETRTKSRKRAALIDTAPPNTYGPLHFKNDNTNGYMPYVPGSWTAQNTYRLPTDIILSTIRSSGTEGLGRFEIGQVLGHDATVKSGGRRVTNYVVTCTNEQSEHIGQYQKMNGKVRTIRYYWKESEQSEKFEGLLSEFEEMTGKPCPFKIGEVIKFPEKNLNTLRISDVSLKRLNRLMQMVNEQRVIVTINRVIKWMSEKEAADGYKFQIDKKSVLKCLLALRTKGFVSVFETVVRSDNVDYSVQIVTHGSITRVDDPEVFKATADILDQYNKEGKVFPHGQVRLFKKKVDETGALEFEENLEDIDEDLSKARTIKDRYHFFRLQTLRNSWTLKEDGEGAEEADATIKEDEEDTPILDDTIEDDPQQVLKTLFAKNPTIATPQKRSNLFYLGRDSLGYQAKSIRLHLLHEMAWHFTRGHRDLERASIFKIFPPTEAFEKWPVRDETTAEVFVDEESPFRFMPAQPLYEGVEQGWFMLQDLLAAMPLSVFVLANYVPRRVQRELLLPFLNDPIKRHLCIGYLPVDIREILMKEKKVQKQMEHCFYLLGAMGLVATGPNPSMKRFPGAASDMFYIATRAELVDTSSSAKGYACVNPPVEEGKYQLYEYELHTQEDVTLYWHHLRAIVQSTPLSYRMDDIGDERSATRHKQFSIGVFDKKIVERDHKDVTEKMMPPLLRDGVAGFDSALFMHLRRHWELTTVPHSIVSWFILKFKRCSEAMKPVIEKRVQVLQKDWNTFARLTLSDADSAKHSNLLKVEYPPKVAVKHFRSYINKPKEDKKQNRNPKKRKPDSVDLVSSSSRISVRCRFSPKERDQLIMIRAVGFFLNPVYRFWLDPTVLRDLMHEFVPESRNKTVQSLMACGVRELVRSNRLAYLQRVVRNLSTFPEMRRLRSVLCSTPVTPGNSKTEFFKDAFRTAMRLLFVDNDRIPHTSISDDSFKHFLTSGNVSVTKETTVSNSLPYRSQKATTIGHVQHCVTSNVLLSVLIHSQDGEFAEKILDEVPPAVLQTVLQALRTDGLVSRSRTEAVSDVSTSKNHATLSYYFRHFFSHRFHSELVEGTGRLLEEMDDVTSADSTELKGDQPEVVVAACSTFYANTYSLEMDVDADILKAFSQIEKDQTIKKIRYLESADLHFEKIHVSLDKVGVTTESESLIAKVIGLLDKSRLVSERPIFEDWVEQFDLKNQIGAILQLIRTSKAAGITTKDIKSRVHFPHDILDQILKDLNDARYILECGVDESRWVSLEYEDVWTVTLNGRKWCPRPWVSPEGTISLPVVRWIAESVLLLIVGKLGIQLKDLLFTYEFAVQPIAIREMVDLLEKLGCIELIEKNFMSPKLASPFSTPKTTQTIVYIHPTVDAVEKFSKIFHSVELLPAMTSKA